MARTLDTISKKSKKIVTKPIAESAPETTPEQPAVEAVPETPTPAPEAEAAPTETPVPDVTTPAPEETAPTTPADAPAVEPEQKVEDAPATPAEPVAPALPPMNTEPPQDDKFETLFPEPSIVVSGPPSWIWWVLLVIASIVLGYLFFDLTKGRIDNLLHLDTTPSPTISASVTPSSSSESPSPSVSPEASPSTTPSPSVATISLRVLNGTTVNGAAAAVKTTLEKGGLTVRTIGNAKTRDTAITTIYYQAGRDAEAAQVKSILGNDAAILEQSDLANPDMVLVLVGKK